MDLRLACALAVCLYSLTPSSAKPTTSLGELQNGGLAEKFVEFLEQDRQFKELISRFEESADGLARHRRQATNTMEDEEDALMDDGTKPKEGFMDRAARFVMELLQRFLRWVNTE